MGTHFNFFYLFDVIRKYFSFVKEITTRFAKNAGRYMHSHQVDLHDAVHKLEKFRSHSGHSAR